MLRYPPQKTPAIFFNERFIINHQSSIINHGCSTTRKHATKNLSSHMFLFAKDFRTMASAREGARDFRRYRRALVYKPAIVFKTSWGGDRRTTNRSFKFATELARPLTNLPVRVASGRVTQMELTFKKSPTGRKVCNGIFAIHLKSSLTQASRTLTLKFATELARPSKAT